MKKFLIYYQSSGTLKTITLNSLEKNSLPKNIVKIKELKSFSLKEISKIQLFEKLDLKTLHSIFLQLNMIINSGIQLQEAIKILLNSSKKSIEKKFLSTIDEALSHGKPIYKAIKIFEKDLDSSIIPLFKILEERGNTNLVLDSLVTILETKIKSRKKLLEAIRYPVMIFITFLFSLTMIFNFVVPKFESIFKQYEMQLPISTVILLKVKDLVSDYGLLILLSLISLTFMLKLFYKANDKTKFFFDKIKVKYLPVVSSIVKTYEFYNFFTSVKILLHAKYEFHLAVDNSLILIKNKYLLDKIKTINNSLNNGKAIKDSFEETLLFDDLILSLLNSGEKSNKIEFAIFNIKDIYSQEFEKSIKRLSSNIEPIFFICISLLVLWIMLAIFTPIWGMSGMLN